MASAVLDAKEEENTHNAASLPEPDHDSKWILDPDPVIKRYCQFKGLKLPSMALDKLKTHLKALNAWIEGDWDPLI